MASRGFNEKQRQDSKQLVKTLLLNSHDIFNHELPYANPTTVDRNSRQEGKLAGELLMRRIADKEATPMTALVPSHLLEGNSIRKLD